MLRPGVIACPAPARASTTELSWAGSPRVPGRLWLDGCIVSLPSPDFHRLDWQPYGLRANLRLTLMGANLRGEVTNHGWQIMGRGTFNREWTRMDANGGGRLFNRGDFEQEVTEVTEISSPVCNGFPPRSPKGQVGSRLRPRASGERRARPGERICSHEPRSDPPSPSYGGRAPLRRATAGQARPTFTPSWG